MVFIALSLGWYIFEGNLLGEFHKVPQQIKHWAVQATLTSILH